MKICRSMLACAGLLALGCVPGWAQQVTGTQGSPGATATITGKQLPPPDPKFGGVINEKASESTPWWASRVVPPKGTPNVLLIMTDTGVLSVDGEQVATNSQEHGIPITFPEDETFDIGQDARRRGADRVPPTRHSSSPARSTS